MEVKLKTQRFLRYGGLLLCSLVSHTVYSASGDSCQQCHQQNEIAELITKRVTHIQWDQLPKVPFALIEHLGGRGSNTSSNTSSNAFSEPDAALSAQALSQHLAGDTFFETNFALRSHPNALASGLGPVFNDNNCESCHPKDGRSALPRLRDDLGQIKLSDAGVFLRISVEHENSFQGEHGLVPRNESNLWGSPTPVANFGTQLFQRGSIEGGQGIREPRTNRFHQPDFTARQSGLADVWMRFESVTVSYADGHRVTLRKPIFEVDNPHDAPDDSDQFDPHTPQRQSALFADNVKLSPRIGLPIFGLGLLEAIPESAILAQVNSDPRRNHGITGRANWVFDQQKYLDCQTAQNCESEPPVSLGRFGWKATTPSVAQQSLGALRGDMGVTNTLFGQESIADTALYQKLVANNPQFAAMQNKGIESTETIDQSLVFYAQTLAVPARKLPQRKAQQLDIEQGAQLFAAANCSGCHTPSFTTGKHPIAELSYRTIYPFSDLLLHDMGEGLADGRRAFDASGQEWRTSPLWGIGRTKLVNPAAGFLHDGRARTIEEAILWHGGEAQASRAYFMQLSERDRKKLLAFVHSL
ncbi:hypothetical protein VST7929_02877 [Vibrio stylophorae]|uniref:Cytochrome c domain-containing protein n=1 Tax=Vibrio stylophorae TaxID=659351 RepID=A0ABN8DYC0_9VIBR|nr:di-heme oxidoredictase family protein [Vibrio stylophorae]CAH0535224.1 hypothetical protein VST7929_02877 [Vibrio stylophorae]